LAQVSCSSCAIVPPSCRPSRKTLHSAVRPSMRAPTAVLAVLAAVSLAESVRVKRRRDSSMPAEDQAGLIHKVEDSKETYAAELAISQSPAPGGVNCSELKGVIVFGYPVGEQAEKLCQFWPPKFGKFPVGTAKTLADLFNGGAALFQRIQNLIKQSKSSTFCWRKFGLRPRSSTCEMSLLGTCYGGCPKGMRSSSLVGAFSPVCRSACVQSGRQTPCGFGCATSALTCVKNVMNQVSATANMIGKVTSFLAGNPAIHTAVNQVLRIIDFAIEILFEVINTAKLIFSQWPVENAELAVVVSLATIAYQTWQKLQVAFPELNTMFNGTMGLILNLTKSEFQWKTIDLKFLSDTILTHGAAILQGAGDFAEVFVHPMCKVVSDTNKDYDCDGDGRQDCGDWDYLGARCDKSTSFGGPCTYKYKFGDTLLDHSCRCSGEKPCFDFHHDYPGSDLHKRAAWTASSIDACQRKCQQHSKCQFFSYAYKRPVFNCFLKTSKAGRKASNRHTSGPKTCPGK